MRDFVVIATFTYPFEYAVLKTLLQQEGIRFVFENEAMINVIPFSSYAIGGIKLKVHKNDVTLAKKIIEDLDKELSPLRIV